MAIQLPTNLYSGEAERINMMPHVQFQTQLMQQKAAKDEAIDQYYKKLPETINQKGVRDQEIPLINGAKNDIQDFYIKNKAAIVNPKLDNGKAQFELQKKYRDASFLVSQSQNRAKTDLELGKMRFEGGKDYIFQNPDFLHKVEAHSKPIGTEGSEALDLATVALPPKPFDPTSFVKEFSDIKAEDDTPQITPHPTDKAYSVVVTPKKLSEDSKMAVYQRAATKFHNDPSFTQNIETIAQDENSVSKLNDAFQSAFKHPIQSKEDLAAAYTLAVMPQAAATQKVIDNEDYKAKQKAIEDARRFAQQKELAGIRFGYQKALKDYSGGVDKTNDENVLNAFIENQYNSGQNKYEHIVVGGNKYTGKVVDVPKTIKDKYIIDKGYDVEKQPDEWLMTTDKTKLVPIFFEKDKNGAVVKTKSGNPKISTTKNSAPIDIQNYKVDLGQLLVSQKSRGGQVVDEFEEESPVVSPIIPSKAKKVTDPAILKALNKQ